MSHSPLEISPLSPAVPFRIVKPGMMLIHIRYCVIGNIYHTEKRGNWQVQEREELAGKFNLVFGPQYLRAATS
jgi:hypothetical protein